MTRNQLQIGAIVCLVAMLSFTAWPFWKSLSLRQANAAAERQAREAVEKNPQLKPAWDIALQDDVLTWPEAKVIVEAAGEKIAPE